MVPHSADTNLADGVCPYDRIVAAAPEGNYIADDGGVDRAFEDDAISDHWPVWVDLRWSPRGPASSARRPVDRKPTAGESRREGACRSRSRK